MDATSSHARSIMMKRSTLLSLLIAISTVLLIAMLAVYQRPAVPPSIDTTDQPDADRVRLVKLTAEASEVARISTHSAELKPLTLTRTVPGRFTYDETSHVAVTTPTDGVLVTVRVNPGDQVNKGHLLATLRSPTVGAARSLLLQRIGELDLAATESDWQATVQDGVQLLIKAIRKRESIDSIKTQLSGSVLGKYRSDLLGKYNAYLLAEQLGGSIEGIRNSGAISGKVARERESKRQEALAQLEASLEQATFETMQLRRETAARTRSAQQAVALARQKLVNLTGQPVSESLGDIEFGDETSLALLEIHSPISGRVQQRLFAATERVETGEELFVIADTSRLWVQADLRGRDLSSVTLVPGDPVELSVGSQPDHLINGIVRFLGREVDPMSGTVPLVAAIENRQEQFRPGLFARVHVPIGQIPSAIVVPDSALIDLDGQPSVFVRQSGGYLPTAVQIGARSGTGVQIVDGIHQGDQVVVTGTFTLKSELLLSGEE